MDAQDTKNNKDRELGTKSVGKLLFSLAVPAITAQIINVLYNVVDRMYIGHIEGIGPQALTGVGVTMPLITAISAFAMLASMGGAPRASILLGRGDREGAQRVLGNCTLLLVSVAAALTVLLLLFNRPILMLFGASENTIGYALEYMNIYAIGTIFVQTALGLNAFITAQGFARTSMLTVLIGAICNIILDPIFIFVFGMGVRGAALATIISQAISSIWVLRFLSSGKTGLRLRLRSMKPDFKVIGPCVALGLSPFIMQFTESVLIVCFNTSLLKYGGDLAVGAMSILTSVMQFIWMPVQGLTQGSQPIIGYNYGACNADRVQKTFKLLLITSVAYTCIFWIICQSFPQLFASFFTNDTQLKEYTAPLLRLYMGATFLLGAQTACQQTFIALGNAKTSLFLALLRKVFLLIPLIYILPNFTTDKVMGVILAEPVADTIAVITTVSMFAYSFRKVLRQMRERTASREQDANHTIENA